MAAKTIVPLWVSTCGLLLLCSSLSGVNGIGVNYGMIGNDLPSPDKVVALYKSHNITDVRLFHPDTSVLEALRGSGLGVVLGTLNEDLHALASDASFAASWVQSYVQPFAGSVNFSYINAGNEVIPGEAAALVLPAMQNLEAALQAAGLSVPVTTAVATSVLGPSYPPSQGAFSEASLPSVGPIVSFLTSRGTPLLVNVYPYFAYSADPSSVPLDYALLSSSAAVAVTDNGAEYANLFDAILDAVYAAVEKAGGGASMELVVSETGWPSGGGVREQPGPARRARHAAAAREGRGDVHLRHLQREPEARGRGAALRALPAGHERGLPRRLLGGFFLDDDAPARMDHARAYRSIVH